MKLRVFTRVLVALLAPVLLGQTAPPTAATYSGAFNRHHIFFNVGSFPTCTATVNGRAPDVAPNQWIVQDPNGASAPIKIHADCLEKDNLGQKVLAQGTWDATVMPSMPDYSAIGTCCYLFPPGSMKTSMMVNALYTGVAHTSGSIFDGQLDLKHSGNPAGAPLCGDNHEDLKKGVKGPVPTAVTASCDTQMLNSAGTNLGDIYTDMRFSATEHWDSGQQPTVGAEFVIRSEYHMDPASLKVSPNPLNITAQLGTANAGSAQLTITNGGGGYLDWNIAPASLTICPNNTTTCTAGPQVVVANPSQGSQITAGQSNTTTIAVDLSSISADFQGKLSSTLRVTSKFLGTTNVDVVITPGTEPGCPGTPQSKGGHRSAGDSPGCQDTVTLTDVFPDPAKGLAAGDHARLNYNIKYTLISTDTANLYMKADYLGDGKTVTKSLGQTDNFQATKSGSTAGPFILPFDVPAPGPSDTNPIVRVTAVLGKTISTPVDYKILTASLLVISETFPGSNSQIFSGKIPQIRATVVGSTNGLRQGTLVLRLLDQSGKTLLPSPGQTIDANTPINKQITLSDVTIPDGQTAVSLMAVFADGLTGEEVLKSDQVFFEVVTPSKLLLEAGTLTGSIFTPLDLPAKIDYGVTPLALRMTAEFKFDACDLILTGRSWGNDTELKHEKNISGPVSGRIFLYGPGIADGSGDSNLHFQLKLKNQWGQELLADPLLVPYDSVSLDPERDFNNPFPVCIRVQGQPCGGAKPTFRTHLLATVSKPVQSAFLPPDVKCQVVFLYRSKDDALFTQNVAEKVIASGLAPAYNTEIDGEIASPPIEDSGQKDANGNPLRLGGVGLKCALVDAKGQELAAGYQVYDVVYEVTIPSGPSTTDFGNGASLKTNSNNSETKEQSQSVPGAIYRFIVCVYYGCPLFGDQSETKNGASHRLSAAGISSAAVNVTNFIGIGATWTFNPPIPENSGFDANLTLQYSPTSFPDDPNFSEAKMQIVSYDPATGQLSTYPTTLDTQNKTATAHITGLAPYYSLGVTGPFQQSALNLPVATGGMVAMSAVGLVNIGTASANLQVTGYNEFATDSTPPPTPGTVSLDPGHQVTNGTADALAALNGPQMWAQVYTDQASVRGFALLSDGIGIDSLPLDGNGGTLLFLSGVEAGTEVHIVNTANLANNVTVELHGPDGSLLGSSSLSLAAKGGTHQAVAGMFQGVPSPLQGYLLVTAQQRVAAALVWTSASALSAVGAQNPDMLGSGAKTYSAPLLIGGIASTRINLINPGTAAVNVTVRAFGDTGTALGQSDSTTLGPGQQYWRDVGQTLGINVASLTAGSISIQSDGPLVGDVALGEPSGRARGQIAIVEPRPSWVIPTVTSGNGLDMLVSVENPGSAPATASVKVFTADGTAAGTKSLTIPAHARLSQLLPLLVPAAAGQMGGHIEVDSTQNLTTLALLGSLTLTSDVAILGGQPGLGSPGGGPGPGSGPAAISVSPVPLDFGNVVVGTSKTATLTVGNTGGAPLTGTVIYPGDRFTASPASFTLQPGEKRDVMITYTPFATYEAPITENPVGIRSNDPVNPNLTIKTTGKVVPTPAPTLSITPAGLDFGTVAPGSPQKILTYVIKNIGTFGLRLNTIHCPAPPFKCGISVDLMAPGDSLTVGLGFSPTSTDPVTGSLWYETNNSANDAAMLYLAGNGGKLPPGVGPTPGMLTATPTSLDFGSTATAVTKTVTLRNTGGTDIAITQTPSITPAGSPFTFVTSVPFTVPANGQLDVMVRFTPPANSTPQMATLAIGSLNIPLTGSGVATPPPGGGQVGTVTSLKLETGSYGTAFSGDGSVWDTDPTTSNFAVGVSIPGETNPLLNPGKAVSLPVNAPSTSYYTYYHSSTFSQSAVRLTVVWSNGNTDVAYFRNAGVTDNTVWTYISGATDLSVTYRKPAMPVCKVVGSNAQPGPCSFPNEILQVTIAGSPSGGGGLTAPSSLDFGAGPTPATKMLTLKNAGATDITINSAPITPAGSPFTVTPLPFTVPANGQFNLSVQFAPTTNAPQSATLTIGSLSVALTGTSTTAGTTTTTSKTLSVDNNMFGTAIGLPTGAADNLFVNRLTPPGYPATLRQVQVVNSFGIGQSALPAGSVVKILVGINPSGNSNINNITLTRTNATMAPGVNTFNITPITLNGPTGDFVVGFETGYPAGITPATIDVSSAPQLRSYFSTDGVTFTVLDANSGVPGNLGIRAIVDVPATSPGGGTLDVTPRSLDFGTLGIGQGKDLPLTVKNNGSTALSVTVSGANSEFSVGPSTSFTIPANSFQSLNAHFAPLVVGQRTDTLTVATTDGTQSIPVSLTGQGNPSGLSLSVSPGSLDFGSVNTGQGKDLTLTVKNNGSASFNAIVTGGTSVFTVSPSTSFPVGANSFQNVTVHFAPTAAGAQSATLTVQTTDFTQSIQVPVTGTGVGAPPSNTLSVSPTSLDFGSVNTGQGKDLTLTVRNNGSASFNAIVTGGTSVFTVSPSTSFPVGANSFQNVTVHFAPTAAGAQSATLTVATTDGTQSIPVTVSGTGVAAPPPSMMSVSPSSLNYGNVNGGQLSPEMGFTVTNNGSATVTITSVTSSNVHFYRRLPQGDPPYGIVPGSNVFISFYFAPELPGPQTGAITIAFSDASIPPLQVAVSGTGVGSWVSPDHYDFGTVKVGQTKDLFISVNGNLNKPINGTVSDSNQAVFTLPFGTSWSMFSGTNILVRFAPAAVGPISGTVTITANDPILGTFTVMVTGTGN
jgi:hypothetical protein